MTKPILTQKLVKELLHYDPKTGIFTRKVRTSNRIRIGDVAGCINKANGYVSFWLLGKRQYAHRIAWLYAYGAMPEKEIDHINHCRHDNRISNLRQVNRIGNGRNITIPKDNKSGHIGVSWDSHNKKWFAQIKAGEKYTFLGRFAKKSDAIAARKAADKDHGFHENHGAQPL